MLVFWIGFLLLIFALLALDLGVLNKNDHEISAKEAMRWTLLWVACAMLFGVFVYFAYSGHWLGIGESEHFGKLSGADAAINFLSGYLIEESLSLDNIFVIALIIKSFGIPRVMQHRVLFWGILGALVLRGFMIIAGAALIAQFHAILYFFGAFLIFTAIKMAVSKNDEQEFNPDKSKVVRAVRKIFPVTSKFDGHNFFTLNNGKMAATPLFVALIVVEFSDLLFAVDSIPAIFAITTDPFLVFTSNIFAIMGLRSLYFALAALMDKFRHLKTSLVFILGFVGVKMIVPAFGRWFALPEWATHPPAYASLVVIFVFLGLGVLVSAIERKN
ncbi:membrane protein [Fibrobacterales bacterium]|nr:membrane protein [Fibrobacterales bacterium]